jgi:hypothetical protein
VNRVPGYEILFSTLTPGEQGRRGCVGRATPVQAGHPAVRVAQQVPHHPVGEVPHYQVPKKHLDDLHPKLSGQEPADNLCLLRGSHEDPACRTSELPGNEYDRGGVRVHGKLDRWKSLSSNNTFYNPLGAYSQRFIFCLT